MPKPRKDGTPINLKIATPVYDRLRDYCEASGQTKTMAIERALTAYTEEYFKEQQLLQKAKKE